jgi:peptidoglycan/xylan/chitin deacetylase (PgdA/CDA1 family)
MTRLLAGLALATLALAAAALLPDLARAADSAVILMYHRFGETRFPSTNIRIAQFEAHIAELKSGPYTVLPVPEIVARIGAGSALPERTVGITVDDGYASVYREAWPRLRAAGLPFTVFVSTDRADRGGGGYMGWEQIRQMRAAGVEIGAHTASHPHMIDASLPHLERELQKSNRRLQAELGAAPALFAYPYGEAGGRERKLALKFGYRAAFGQHSGVFHKSAEPNYIPRFALNENFGAIGRFRLVINTLAIPVLDVAPRDAGIGATNPPNFGFTVAEDIGNLARLGCFSSSEGRARVEILGTRRVEVRLRKPLPRGRTRINCTLRDRSGRWRWLGTIFYVPPK